MWLSRVWSERCESHKEQNKAFKLLSCSYQRNRTLQKKRKKETEQNSLNKTKQRRRRRRTVSYGPRRPGEVFEFQPESAASPNTD